MKQTVISIGKVVLAALALLLVLALIAGLAGLCAKTGFGAIYWRLCAGVDGIVLLMIAVLLLTHRKPGRGQNNTWEKCVPKLSILAALLIISVLLTAAASIVNDLVA